MIRSLLLFILGFIVVALAGFLLKKIVIYLNNNYSRFRNNKLYSVIYKFISRDTTNSGFKELIIAIIGGLVVAFFSPFISETYENQKRIDLLDERLQDIQIGVSRAKVEEYFGAPTINKIFRGNYPEIDINYDGIIDVFTFTSAGYTIGEHSALLCMYRDETLDAFVIICNDKDLYKVKSLSNLRLYDKEVYLGQFTYAGFNDDISGGVVINAVEGSHGNYYYTERYGTSAAELNQYEILGNYYPSKYFYSDEEIKSVCDIVRTGMHYSDYNNIDEESDDIGSIDEEFKEKTFNQLKEYRIIVKPNVYGRVNYTIADEFNYVIDILGSDYYLLFK